MFRAQLLKEHSRANAEIVANHVGDDQQRFNELMRCMLQGERTLAQRAAFSVGIVGGRHPHLLPPHLDRMLRILDRPVHDAIHRNVIGLLQTCELPRRLHARIIAAVFPRIADPGQPIAVRAFSITVAQRLVVLHPDLRGEFELLLEQAMHANPGPAIRSRARKAISLLHKETRQVTTRP